MRIDLNCDMGESFGRYSLGNDALMMPHITSANIACGLHAGDPSVMDATLRLAAQHGVGVGAHPGFPDLQGFGRRSMGLSPDEIEAFVLYQVAALAGFAGAAGVELIHVKPHGALYNMAAQDRDMAQAIARGVARFSNDLVLVGLSGSRLVEAGVEAGLRVAREAFADRAYNPDASLRSRRLPGAVLESPQDAAAQAVRLARDGMVIAHNGEKVPVEADTLCIHGDTATAVDIVQAIRRELAAVGVQVAPMGSFVWRSADD
ncbi:MAG: lactam utilization protein LamB [Anaerolineaceae bacterium 4572_32.2]|nr:MAG: lactam utilization protein LamB [Anaerolineaceae bacterium 4572_32.2]